ADLTDAAVAVLLRDDVLLAARLDIGELQLLAEDLGQLLEHDIDLDHMLPGLGPGLATALLRVALADRVADLAVALDDAAALLGAIAELRDIDLRQRDRDILAPLAADHLALRHIFAQIFLDLTAHDLAKTIQIALDTSD